MNTTQEADGGLSALWALAEAEPELLNQLIGELRRGAAWAPHQGGQEEVLAHDARFKVLRAGRRWGKTELAAHMAIQHALDDGKMVWWVANNDRNVRRGYRKVLQQLPRTLLRRDPPSDRANDRVIEFKNGSTMEFYTAGTPDSLVGEGVDYVVVDEAALIEESIWFQRIRPTLLDSGGGALIISTPRGRNWFHKLWHRGQRGGQWASWHFTSYDNPINDPAELDDLRETDPWVFFAQEYLAEFVANAASIFQLEGENKGRRWNAVREALDAPSGQVVLGVDLGRRQDFTVLDACNAETRMPCYLERFNEIGWSAQRQIIVSAANYLASLPEVEEVMVAVDATEGSVGDVVVENLEEDGLDVIGVSFSSGTNAKKEQMVRRLAGDIEHGLAFIHEDSREEFEHYEYEITEAGRWKFAAPEGEHDDRVAAKLVQHWAMVAEGEPDMQIVDSDAPDPRERDDAGESEPIRPDSPQDIMSRPEAWAGR